MNYCSATCVLFASLVLSGCGTPGSLKKDRHDLDAEYASVGREGAIVIIFNSLPGTVGDSVCVGPSIWGHGYIEASHVAVEEAHEVLSKIFSNVKIYVGDSKTKNFTDDAEVRFVIRIEASASTSALRGAHVATIQVVALDRNDTVVFEYTDTAKVIDGFQYAQEDTMQRAFILVYRRLADRIIAYRQQMTK